MQFKSSVMLIVALGISGCASLPDVRNFSADTITLADSIDLIAQDTSASCLRRLSLDVPIRGIADERRKTYLDVCNQLKQASGLLTDLNGTMRAYGRVLGQLADNKRVSLDAEIAGAKSAIATLNNQTDNPYFDTAQLNAVGSLADAVLRAATDTDRQREIRRVLDHHDDLAQLATVLQTFINRAYLPVLANEEGNLGSLEEILNDRHIRTEPLRARELLELLKQQRVNLAERKKTAGDVLNAITKMIEAHASLLQNADKLDDKELVQLLADYGRKIQDVSKQIRTSFQ